MTRAQKSVFQKESITLQHNGSDMSQYYQLKDYS